MSTAEAPPKLMTAEEFLALPDDGMERWLIRGELRPREAVMAVRNKKHSRIEVNIAYVLEAWECSLSSRRGQVVAGDAGFRLLRTPDSLVGIDVAYASAELVAASAGRSYFDGPPVLAIEILSPSDKHEEVVEKINDYLTAGSVVWQVDPDFRRISVYRPGEEAEHYNAKQELIGDPYLAGFRVAVGRIFQD